MTPHDEYVCSMRSNRVEPVGRYAIDGYIIDGETLRPNYPDKRWGQPGYWSCTCGRSACRHEDRLEFALAQWRETAPVEFKHKGV